MTKITKTTGIAIDVVRKKDPPMINNGGLIFLHIQKHNKITIKEIKEILEQAKFLYIKYEEMGDEHNHIGTCVNQAVDFIDRKQFWEGIWLRNICMRAIEKACPNHYMPNVDWKNPVEVLRLVDRALEIVEEWKITRIPLKCFFAKEHLKAYYDQFY